MQAIYKNFAFVFWDLNTAALCVRSNGLQLCVDRRDGELDAEC